MQREAFLLRLLAVVLIWQAAIFSYGVHRCSTTKPGQVTQICPKLGDRFDTFTRTTLGAVLGLLAGASIQRKD
mgnify:CR=1 FL=1